MHIFIMNAAVIFHFIIYFDSFLYDIYSQIIRKCLNKLLNIKLSIFFFNCKWNHQRPDRLANICNISWIKSYQWKQLTRYLSNYSHTSTHMTSYNYINQTEAKLWKKYKVQTNFERVSMLGRWPATNDLELLSRWAERNTKVISAMLDAYSEMPERRC